MRRQSAAGRWDVPTAAILRRLAVEPLPLRLRATPPIRVFMREIYYDTTDLVLRSRGVTCRVRHRSDDRLELAVSVVEDRASAPEITQADADLPSMDAEAALGGTNDAARLLRSIVNPATLSPQLELEIERQTRTVRSRWMRRDRFELDYDVVTVRAAGLARSFQEIALRTVGRGRPTADDFARALVNAHALRSLTIDRRERGEQVRAALESEALARGVKAGSWVAVIALDGTRVAYLLDAGGVRIPLAEGSGEEACRSVLRRGLGSSVGDLRLLSTVQGSGRLRSLEVWAVTRVDRSAAHASDEAVSWTTIDKLLAMIGTPAIHDAGTLAALTALARSPELRSLITIPAAVSRSGERAIRRTTPVAVRHADDGAIGPLLDGAMTLLAFNQRVLELAEDRGVPLLERLRYLAIVSANLDEFFAVQVGGLKHEDQEQADEESPTLPFSDRMLTIAERVRGLVTRQAACAAECERLLASHDIHIRALSEVTAEEDQYLRTYFRGTVLPYLTPKAVTATPGHSLPLMADQVLRMAVVLREPSPGEPLHLADLTIPTALPRFLPLPSDDATSAAFVPLEDLIRREAAQAYPGRRVHGAHIFRLTRYADLGVLEGETGNLAQTIEERSNRRRHQPVVRIEVEPTMPAAIREQLVRELQLEPGARPATLGLGDVYAIPGRIDLRALSELADLPRPDLRFPTMAARTAIPPSANLWELLRQRDVLLHHPYDGFATSVVRFFEDASADPDVVSIKATLYRVGEQSPILDALLRAATAGKDVTVFLELKARFDEQRNIMWARRLESAGAHVVQGISGLKNHSKMALAVRREPSGARRYAHIGTGNYNAGTARFYTDLGLLTAHEGICMDVNDLFNTLTGSSVPADVAYRECLVSPNALLDGLLQRIEREAAHAQVNGRGRIRMKVNGLSDREVVQALYRAARAGVQIDLIVRGICTLCPGLPGVSDRIRVVSILGRFLEHARIFVFDNAGAPEYFIGSADMRPRNLRRRVEVLVPVHGANDRARLDHILDVEFNDPTAWVLASDGSYQRRSGVGGVSAQAQFMAEAGA